MKRKTALLTLIGSCLAATFVPAEGPKTYGNTVSYVRVSAVALTPLGTSLAYAGTYGQRWGLAQIVIFYAPLTLPSGARIVSLDFDAVDTDPSGFLQANLNVCDRYGDNCVFHPVAAAGPADCLQAGFICSGEGYAGGPVTHSADLTPDAIVVDPVDQTLFLGCRTYFDGDDHRCAGFLVGYQLQVSPAPAVATFGDVPTNHPFFQFVEALVASGVTAGCGGGNYCPDNPITRGQMAVFLARALGLQFP